VVKLNDRRTERRESERGYASVFRRRRSSPLEGDDGAHPTIGVALDRRRLYGARLGRDSRTFTTGHSERESIDMLTSILGARLSWHFANGWVFEPATVGPDTVDYSLKEGPHAGRHAIQHFRYQRVAPGVETTVWYEESGAVVHMTWYLETQTVHRFAALPAWLAEDMTVYRGDNQDPAFIEKIRTLISQRQDWPRHILDDDGYFRVI
jgi:phenolic acid decarboxylase